MHIKTSIKHKTFKQHVSYHHQHPLNESLRNLSPTSVFTKK